jgi:hypothetical protein
MTMTDDLARIAEVLEDSASRATNAVQRQIMTSNAAVVRDAKARIEALTAERDQAWKMVAEADTRLGQALGEAIQDKADNARLRAERDAILADSTINSDQRAKYEALRARLSVGKASEHEAINAIRQLCQDNERLALRCSDARAALNTGKEPSHE